MNTENQNSSQDRDTIINTLRWHKFDVLDSGYVCLVDVMGNDTSVVQAARVSYGEGTSRINDDKTLIRYLMRHRHTTPFEMAEIKFLVRVPMDTWRQWIRHRMASVNEYSTRYSLAIDAAQTTSPEGWRSQSKTNNQGSDHALPEDIGKHLTTEEKKLLDHARDQYHQRIDHGVAREQARKDLPLSTYTEAYWKIDLHNLLHFLALRMDSHAQLEIRQYATTIGEKIVAKLFPIVWEAFIDYRMDSMQLTKLDIGVINRLSNIGSAPPWSEISFLSVQDKSWAGFTRCRERDECLKKLQRLGLVADTY